MTTKIFTRMGDGELVSMSPEEVKEDILAATEDAAKRADISELTADEIEQLLDIMAEPSRAVSVAAGQEVIVTDDGCSMSFYSGQDGGGVGVPLSRLQAVLTYER
ncbi:MAG: [dimethylamine--corrinoid protein] Co-methyltransferase, partial [Deltaproteobacteria bacterium]|nr:[dimethylamine--corrinoid protein] Co-methyltransferase [Deltaproteobacteria bacterium]